MKKKNKIKIKLNGKLIMIDNEFTLYKLLTKFKVPLKKVAIERNGVIANKNSLNKVKILNNDKIEVVHFIGGG